jgi:hypothetical protein
MQEVAKEMNISIHFMLSGVGHTMYALVKAVDERLFGFPSQFQPNFNIYVEGNSVLYNDAQSALFRISRLIVVVSSLCNRYWGILLWK